MPSLNSIIGLEGIELENAVETTGIEVQARAAFCPACVHCGNFRCRIKSSFVRKLKHSRLGTRLVVVHIRSHKYYCLRCKRFFNLRIPGILPRKRSTENFRMEVYEKHHGGISQSLLSKTHEISHATVERWYQDFIKKRVNELKSRHCPKMLGIDEHFFTKKRGYATTFCDLKNHKIFDVRLGRSESSLNPYLEGLSERYRTKAIVMDLSETYRSIAKKHFPNAMIVADRFHVIRLVNFSFLKAWAMVDPIGRKNRGLLSLMRRHKKNLASEQIERLNQYLKRNPVLQEIYQFKQQLNEILLTVEKNKALLRPKIYALMEMIQKLQQTSLEPLKTLGTTLERWKEEIGRMMRFSKTNSITEGFHNKMEMLSRRAFGFRNFNNYRMRVLAHCGWDGVFTRT
jgi:transposase